MCGINGIARADGAPCEGALVLAMNEALRHRGPDDGGVAELGFAALGMRRLSIVDLAHGRQPLASPDGRFVLVYNGELYDHREQRERLRAAGHRFRTSSDTEVLLATWEADGERSLPTLDGMFAFAVADTRERTLTLARDPLGIKPLFYTLTPRGELVFSSEPASLLAHPRVRRVLDRRSLVQLLVDRTTPDPWTLLDGVYQLPPGHRLSWRDGRIDVRPYWRLALEPEPRDEEQALEELCATLADAVRSQLVADVPVGVFLSGGIDSSTVAALAARERRERGERVKTFSVGFARQGFDESALARAVARHLDTEHHELAVESARFEPELLETIVAHAGQPLVDLSCIPTLLLARFARREVAVALSGDGGDELFGGYDHMFWAARVRRVGERAPLSLRRLGSAVLTGVAPMVGGRAAGVTRRLGKGLGLSLHPPFEQLRRLMCLFTPEEALALVRDAPPLRALELGSEDELARLAPEELAMAALTRTYLPATILAKVDRMSMAASLEVRVPLLGRRVVELARRLPLALKVRGRRGKHLLRRAGEELLPASVYSHPKQGFVIPLHDWLNDAFWDLFEELYRPGTRAASLFEPRALRAVLERGRAARRDDARLTSQSATARAWTLALLGRWIERFDVEVAT